MSKAVTALASPEERAPDPLASPAPAVPRNKLLLKSVAGLVLLGFLVGALIFNQSIKTRAKVGEPAPDWTAEDLDGRPVSLADFRGRVVLLNFWTSWCISCREETSALQAFHRRYGDRVTVVGLNIREPLRTIRDYMEKSGMTFTVLRDRNGRIPGRYNLQKYPESWFIDAGGVARVFWPGAMNFEQMQLFYRETTGKSIDGDGVGPVQGSDRLLAAAPAGDGTLWAGTAGGLWRRPAGGEWGKAARDPGLDRTAVSSLVFPAQDPGTLLAAGPALGVVRSRDGGRSWQDAGRGLPGKAVSALAASPRGDALYAWVAGRGLHRSGDGGGTWSAAGGLDPALPVIALAVDPADPRRLLAAWAREGFAGSEGQLLASADGGRTFRPVPVEEEILNVRIRPTVLGIAFDPARPGTVLLATDKGVWKGAADGRGATWLRGSPARRFESVAAGGGLLTAAAANGDIYVSRDAGASWVLE